MKDGPSHPWYDASKAPFFAMMLPDRFTDAELAGALSAVTKWMFEVNEPFAFIVNMRKPLAISSTQRKMIALAENSYKHIDRKYNACQAVIVPDAVTRGALTAIYWLSPPVYPVRTFSDLTRALAWLEPTFNQACAEFPNGAWWSARKAGSSS